jgi:D-alanine-D-alanine ligase
MGGLSAEREVSLRSGRAVAAGLERAGYSVCEVDVRGRGFRLPPGVEAVFIALHGEFGEDGEVQSDLDGRGIPYTGSGAAASRAAFDKVLSKRCFETSGIPTPAYAVLNGDGIMPMSPPLVVKPPRQGSSIGCSIVDGPGGWAAAVRESVKYERTILVERYIEGRELTVGVLGNEALPVIEIVAPGGNYDYTAKYTAGRTRYLAPAPISPEEEAACRDVSMRVFKVLGCRGMGRVDIRMGRDGVPYVLELNSIPGFTETSLLPKAAACAGIGFPELCGRIMELAAFDRG